MGVFKPFKAPSLVGKNTLNSRPPPQLDEDRPSKKRRKSNDESSDEDVESITAAAKVLKKPKIIPKFQPLMQKPVNTVANPSSSSSNAGIEVKTPSGQEGYYTVLWYVEIYDYVIRSHSNVLAGAKSQTRRTRHGTAMVFCPSLTATQDSKISPAKTLVELYARCHHSRDLRCRSLAKKSK